MGFQVRHGILKPNFHAMLAKNPKRGNSVMDLEPTLLAKYPEGGILEKDLEPAM